MAKTSPATQTELARRLGLSRSTVAAALNPKSSVVLREETIQLVRHEASRLNYRPNQYAQVMRRGRSGLIGVFHFGGLSQVAAERAWHACKAIERAGYKTLSNDVSWSSGGTKAGCDAMRDAQVEGILVTGLNDAENESELIVLHDMGIPIVTIGNEIPGLPYVRGDARDAMLRMARHLLALGRKRLVLLTTISRSHPWAGAERAKGFEAAFDTPLVEQFSLRPSAPKAGRVILHEASEKPFDRSQLAREAMKAILGDEVLPDAVLCGDDDWAIGALAACRDAGIGVPSTIAITGYDDTSIGRYLDIPLTTVAQPSEAMVQNAVELLLKLMAGKKPAAAARCVKLPCKIIIRRSCGAI